MSAIMTFAFVLLVLEVTLNGSYNKEESTRWRDDDQMRAVGSEMGRRHIQPRVECPGYATVVVVLVPQARVHGEQVRCQAHFDRLL